MGYITNLDFQHASVITQSPYRLSARIITIVISRVKEKHIIDGLSKQNQTTK